MGHGDWALADGVALTIGRRNAPDLNQVQLSCSILLTSTVYLITLVKGRLVRFLGRHELFQFLLMDYSL